MRYSISVQVVFELEASKNMVEIGNYARKRKQQGVGVWELSHNSRP